MKFCSEFLLDVNLPVIKSVVMTSFNLIVLSIRKSRSLLVTSPTNRDPIFPEAVIGIPE